MDRSRHVLRLASVFEPPVSEAHQVQAQAGYDPIGGMQNHTALLTRALDARGVRQTVITSRLGGPATVATLGRHARIHRVGLPIRHLRQAWAAAALAPALRAGPVDLVHAHQGEDLVALPLALLAARRAGCPLVVTLHTSVRLTVAASGPKLTAVRVVGGPLESAALRAADAVIALTSATADRLGDVRDRTVVIPSGADAGRFPASPGPLLAGVPGPIVLYLGRLARQKSVPTLVEAFGRMTTPAVGPPSLVIVGDGPDAPRVAAAIDALPGDVRSRVHRFGFRPHDEVPALLAAADLLVLPSIYEEMGSILVEALSAGLPVVASRVGGIPQVVRDGTTGLLVPPEDPAALATAIGRVLADPELAGRMRAASLQAARRYDWTELSGQVLEVYEAALSSRPVRPASRRRAPGRTADRDTVRRLGAGRAGTGVSGSGCPR
ncbi:glycosyltransferase family 4 protein [Nakamurella leprariae]|uniref:Glycosyltransferase family 4 protein n=1 Tax=Nakamurella leprariae TaxID=2803911 RepID=A0A938YFK7_9ACTN|nr:glycosyltransferase family 4 protein [Nakamurella leprariae]MBM9466908.1 glycosyltransferase family 4 protein [Nakamurella leprariae]